MQIVPKSNIWFICRWLLQRTNARSTGSFSFQNAFFYLQWGDDDWVYNTNDPLAANLVTLKKTRRRSKLHPHKQRSKYICKPELVVEAGNHFVWEYIPGHGTFNVPSDAAILHHYRICEFGGDDCIKTASTIDTTTFKYRDRLVKAVKSKYDEFKGRCSLKDPPPPPRKVFEKLVGIFNDNAQKEDR